MRLRRSHGAPRKVAELDADAHGPEKPKQSYAWHLRLLPICELHSYQGQNRSAQ